MNPLFKLRWLFSPGMAFLRFVRRSPGIGLVLIGTAAVAMVLMPQSALVVLLLLLLYILVALYMLRFIEFAPQLVRVIVILRDDIPTELTLLRRRVNAKRTLSQAGILWDQLRSRFPEIIRFEPLIDGLTPARLLDLERKAAQKDPAYRPKNLANYFRILAKPAVNDNLLIAELEASPSVKTVYRASDLRGASGPAPFEPWSVSQLYLNPQPEGIDAFFAYQKGGGKGEGTHFVDVERAWPLKSGQDLRKNGKPRISKPLYGLNDSSNNYWFSHGQFVLGIVMAVDNELEVLGVAHEVGDPQVVSFLRKDGIEDPETAVLQAANYLDLQSDPGGVVLLEMETTVGSRPIEVFASTLDAILLATALGFVVVEPAGNGTTDLDTDPDLVEDSGAIFVAGGTSLANATGGVAVTGVGLLDEHAAYATTNWGSRVNCYAWGEKVITTKSSPWAGTSPAAAIIAGAAILVQGVQKAAGRPTLNSKEMRAVFADPSLGTPHIGPKNIGSMPDLSLVLPYLESLPDVWIRDSPEDVGNPHTESSFDSPDIIVRSQNDNPALLVNDPAGSADWSQPWNAGTELFIFCRLRNRGATDVTATIDLYGCSPSLVPTDEELVSLGTTTVNVEANGGTPFVSEPIRYTPPTNAFTFLVLVSVPGIPSLAPRDFSSVQSFSSLVGFNRRAAVRNAHISPYVATTTSQTNLNNAGYASLSFKMPLPKYHLFYSKPNERKTALQIATDLPVGSNVLLVGPTNFVSTLGVPQPSQNPGFSWLAVTPSPQGTTFPGTVWPTTQGAFDLQLLIQIPAGSPSKDYKTVIKQYYGGAQIGALTWISRL